jgi:hypothetical protein
MNVLATRTMLVVLGGMMVLSARPAVAQQPSVAAIVEQFYPTSLTAFPDEIGGRRNALPFTRRMHRQHRRSSWPRLPTILRPPSALCVPAEVGSTSRPKRLPAWIYRASGAKWFLRMSMPMGFGIFASTSVSIEPS